MIRFIRAILALLFHPRVCVWCGTDAACECVARARCKRAGVDGHEHCGTCTTHGKPRFVCGCRARPPLIVVYVQQPREDRPS